jgi:hypothetical protein
MNRPRHFCAWIADPGSKRCPRAIRTGQPCWCYPTAFEDAEAGWEWRIMPPFVGEEEQEETWRSASATGSAIKKYGTAKFRREGDHERRP